nr:release factor glutamine methyltransferase [Quercus suber]
MKLSFIGGCSPSNLSVFVNTNLLRPICFSSMSSPPTSLKPQIPLFLRPPLHSASVSDIRKWHDWAKNLASSVGTTFVDSDNGPDSDLLCRELKWLMEDAIEDHTRIEERRPFQYLVGCEHWRDLVLSVQDGVLILGPETKLIVDLVADVVSNNEGLREGLWADLRTGTGALAIGIRRILGSRGRVIATDLSPVALSVAAFNVQKYGLQVNEVIIVM